MISGFGKVHSDSSDKVAPTHSSKLVHNCSVTDNLTEYVLADCVLSAEKYSDHSSDICTEWSEVHMKS